MGEMLAVESSVKRPTCQFQWNWCNEEKDRFSGILSPPQVQGRKLPTLWVPETPAAEKPDSGEQVE